VRLYIFKYVRVFLNSKFKSPENIMAARRRTDKTDISRKSVLLLVLSVISARCSGT